MIGRKVTFFMRNDNSPTTFEAFPQGRKLLQQTHSKLADLKSTKVSSPKKKTSIENVASLHKLIPSESKEEKNFNSALVNCRGRSLKLKPLEENLSNYVIRNVNQNLKVALKRVPKSDSRIPASNNSPILGADSRSYVVPSASRATQLPFAPPINLSTLPNESQNKSQLQRTQRFRTVTPPKEKMIKGYTMDITAASDTMSLALDIPVLPSGSFIQPQPTVPTTLSGGGGTNSPTLAPTAKEQLPPINKNAKKKLSRHKKYFEFLKEQVGLPEDIDMNSLVTDLPKISAKSWVTDLLSLDCI